jgi:AP-3 complex subunit mu
MSGLTASFDITITSRLTTRLLENVVVELNLGEGASAIKCVAARGTGGLGRGGVGPMDMGIGGSSGASWTFDIKKRVIVFFTKELPPSFRISIFSLRF